MLPAPSTTSNKPDKKKLTLFFPGISSKDVQQGQNDSGLPGAHADASSPQSVTAEDAKETRRKQMIRDGIILFLTIALAVVYIVLGPAGEFIAGRAFTITTMNEVTYIYYNWTLELPASTPTLDMDAYNNRLVGSVLFTPAPATDNHFTISVETTVRNGPFTLYPWTTYENQKSGFTVTVSDLVPNTYQIDYANIIVHIPSYHAYSELLWNITPVAPGPSTLPIRKWNVAFNNLSDAHITFEKIHIVTDGGTISSDGVRASEGYFQTSGGLITGEYTVPPSKLTFNMSGGGSFE